MATKKQNKWSLSLFFLFFVFFDKCVAAIFIALFCAMELPVVAAGWTPIRVVITDKTEYRGRSICDVKRTTTIGLDLGLWQSGTCTTAGVQLAPAADAQHMYGVQLGLISAHTEVGYGLQIGGLFTQMEGADNKSFMLQIAGIANNPMFMYPPSINGTQIAPIGNAAGHLNGMQIGLVNLLAEGHALQAGLVNIQVDPGGNTPGQFIVQIGGYNTRDNLNGLQFGIINSLGNAENKAEQSKSVQLGIFNHAYSIKGFQLGVVNRAVKLAGLQIGLVNMVSTQKHLLGIPFSPILNFSW